MSKKSNATELANLRAVFTEFDRHRNYPKLMRVEGCELEINLTKGVATIIKGSKIIMRITGVTRGMASKEMIDVAVYGKGGQGNTKF